MSAAPTSPSPGASAAAAPASSAYPDAADVEWAGDPGFPPREPEPALDIVAKDDEVAVKVDPGERFSTVQRVRFHREIVWVRRLPGEFVTTAAVLADSAAGRVFVAQYSAISSGAIIHALDLATSQERWAQSVQGLGPISHSKYYNHVVLKLVRGALVVFGNEAQGRYIEVIDPKSGRTLSNRRLPAAR